MLVHQRVNPSIKFAGNHLYTWVEKSTVKVKCLAQEHNTMCPAKTWTRTARSRDECTNHEATTLPKKIITLNSCQCLCKWERSLFASLNAIHRKFTRGRGKFIFSTSRPFKQVWLLHFLNNTFWPSVKSLPALKKRYIKYLTDSPAEAKEFQVISLQELRQSKLPVP